MLRSRGIVIATLTCAALALTACGGGSGTGQSAAAKEAFLPKSPQMLIPFSPGGGMDLAGRTVVQVLNKEKIVPSQIQITNMPGGSARVGMQYMVNDHKGDGDQLMVIANHIILTPMFQGDGVTYKDLTPLGRLYAENELVVVRSDSKFKTMKDLVDALRADPSSVRIGGASAASMDTIIVGELADAMGVDAKKLTYAPYDGAGATPQLLGNHIDVELGGPDLLDLIKGGKMRALGITADKRLAGDLADVPTMKEQGIDVVESNWRVIFGPPDMPAPAAAYWRDALKKMSETTAWKSAVTKYSWVPFFDNSPDALNEFFSQETDKYRKSLKALGLIK